MKKKSILFGVILLLVMFSPFLKYNIEAKDKNGIFVVSRECPAAYYEYTEENINRFLNMVESEENENDGIAIIGTPFSFCNYGANIFYFPIIYNDEIKFTFRVFTNDNDEFEGILSKAYVTELNVLATEVNKDNPVVFMMENDSVIMYIGNCKNVIHNYPEGSIGSKTFIPISEIINGLNKGLEYEVVDITNPRFMCEITFAENSDSVKNILREEAPLSKYLGSTSLITEQQTIEHWCAAFSTAWIMRYCFAYAGDTTTAYDVMCSQYSNPTYTDTLVETQVVSYANSRGLWPINYAGTLSNFALIS